MPKLYEQSIFAMAHVDLQKHPANNFGRTLRFIVEPNTEAVAIMMRFSNEYSDCELPIASVALALAGACEEHIEQDTLTPVTVKGKSFFVLKPGEEIWSDEIPFCLSQNQSFFISIYYPTDVRVNSGNLIGTIAQRSTVGNHTTNEEISGLELASRLARTFMHSDLITAITSVSEIVALRETPGKTIACFGDSITQQGNWTVPLAKRLHLAYPGEISLCNVGISGNRLFHDSPVSLGNLNGRSGISRFEQHVLSLSGLTHVIIELGSNDLGLPDGKDVPLCELITAEEYITAVSGFARELKKRGIKTFIATIAPRLVDSKPFNAAREAVRLHINEKLRESTQFDAVLDFDEALRRNDDKTGMRDGFALIDGLHPSPLGGLHIAKAIDISLFGGLTP